MNEQPNVSTNHSRVNTDIPGLEILLESEGIILPGISRNPNGLVVLIKGKPGIGKSTFVLQLMAGLVKSFSSRGNGRPSYYLNMEQAKYDVVSKYFSLGLQRIITEASEEKYKIFMSDKTASPDLFKQVIQVLTNVFLRWLWGHSAKDKNDHEFCVEVLGELGKKNKALKRLELILDSELTSRRMKKNRFNEELSGNSAGIRAILRNDGLLRRIASFMEMAMKIDYLSEGGSSGNASILTLADLVRIIQKDIADEARGKKCPVLAIDSLNTFSPDERNYLNVHNIVNHIRGLACITIVVYEPTDKESQFLEYLADITFEMREQIIKEPIETAINELRINKARYQSIESGWHQYKITPAGIQIYPSTLLHLKKHLPDDESRVRESLIPLSNKRENDNPTGEACFSVIGRLLGGNIKTGSSTVLLGPRATLKTELTIDFLTQASNEGKKGIIISLVDNFKSDKEIIQGCIRRKGSGEDIKCINNKKCLNNLFLYQQKPGDITVAEFFENLDVVLKRHIESDGKAIKRAAFWDMTQLEYRFPFMAGDPLFITTLMNFFKQNDISSIYIGAGNVALSKAAAAMADNVIYTWNDTLLEDAGGMKNVLVYFIERNASRSHGNEALLTYIVRSGQEGEKGPFSLGLCGEKAIDEKLIGCDDPSRFRYAVSNIANITAIQGIGPPDSIPEKNTPLKKTEAV
jgi:KaiC/GvpD/RAD55 family RecA-like ATPase